jgi:CheY-like chemotaxis protein
MTPLGTIAILVIEDDAAIRELLREIFTARGFAVVTARQGAEALEILERGVRPTLIVLDIVMPIMGGDQFLKELRANEELKNIPVLVTSATKEKPPTAEGFVAKPFELATLFEAARPYLPAGPDLTLAPA